LRPAQPAACCPALLSSHRQLTNFR
jgi:hypothetical protein